MKSVSVVFLLASQALALARAAPASVPHAPDDGCGRHAICGLKNPEDMVRLGDSRFAIASSLARGPAPSSHLYLVDLEARKARLLVPTVQPVAQDEYPGCPPPDPDSLITHGLAARTDGPDRGRLFVVNHGGRESIEIFRWRVKSGNVALAWAGCVLVPHDVLSNAVVPLPDGLAVTSFGSLKDPKLTDLLAGRPSGFVAIWTSAKGWTHLEGSELPGDNGIEASADGRTLYVDAWAQDALWVLARDGSRAPVRVALGDFHPDNVNRQRDGTLLITGQVGAAASILACGPVPFCPLPSMVVVFDPKQDHIVFRKEYPAMAHFGAASTSLHYRGHYWLSSFLGDRIVEVGPG